MLRPFKSFLNNLQKNAGATIFGILPDMSTNLEDEEEIVADNMYSSSEMDPLADPLALDDEIINQTVENESDFASENTTITDLDSSGDAQIILVDVNSLKSSFPMPVSYANDSYESNESVVRNNHIQNSELPAGTSEQNVNRDDDGIGVTYEPIALALDDEINDEVEGVRSDGSDSGLGLELSAGLLSEKPNETSPIVQTVCSRSNLKRRSDPSDQIDVVDTKKPKRNIQFSGVTVYYFPRIQGFTCIPSQGGCTLGMGPHHYEQKSFSLSEHTVEQKRLHRQQMLEQNPRPLTNLTTATNATDERSRSSTEESDSEEELLSDNSSSELDTETNGFLQPVPQRQRRALLKAAGIREIASFEKNDCRDIRASREFCGCNCRDYCDPDTCLCSQAGIKCQVDRASFPCGCTQDGCGNVFGRIEFNPKRVRTHFIHTIMRLELEKKQKKSDKHNSLNTYDGRLRLRDSDDDSTTVDSPNVIASHHQPSLGQLVTYSPSNNIIYPATMSTPNNSLTDTVDGHSSYNTNDTNNISRNCGVTESTLDLHYAFRNDYQMDMVDQDRQAPSYTMYSNSSYFASTSSATAFDDFTNINATSQSDILPNYSNYSAAIPYAGLLGNITNCSGDVLDGVTETCSNYINEYSLENHEININSALFDGSHDDLNELPSLSTPTVSNLNMQSIDTKDLQTTRKSIINSEYECNSKKIIDSATDLNALLDENGRSVQTIVESVRKENDEKCCRLESCVSENRISEINKIQANSLNESATVQLNADDCLSELISKTIVETVSA